jgi:hypothetical protein
LASSSCCIGAVLGRSGLAPRLVDERLGGDEALTAVLGDDVRIRARRGPRPCGPSPRRSPAGRGCSARRRLA